MWRCFEVLLGICLSPCFLRTGVRDTTIHDLLSQSWGDQLALSSADSRYQGPQVDRGSSWGTVSLWRKYPSSLSRQTPYICRDQGELLMSWTLFFFFFPSDWKCFFGQPSEGNCRNIVTFVIFTSSVIKTQRTKLNKQTKLKTLSVLNFSDS